jgi:hypothetical protein
MPDSKPTTSEGRRFVSNAIAFKTLQRRLQQELPAAQVEIAENMVLDALHGKEVDADHQFAGVAAHAVETRDTLQFQNDGREANRAGCL